GWWIRARRAWGQLRQNGFLRDNTPPAQAGPRWAAPPGPCPWRIPAANPQKEAVPVPERQTVRHLRFLRRGSPDASYGGNGSRIPALAQCAASLRASLGR